MTTQNEFQEKLNRIHTAARKETPDRVPVLPNIETWVYQYAGVSVREAFLNDENAAVEAFRKFNEDVYVDGMLGTSNIVPLKMMELFGEGLYTVSEEGLQIKGSHGVTMQPEDYAALIKDPQSFFANVILPRKYPVLAQSADANKELLAKAFDEFAAYAAYNGRVAKRIVEDVKLPMLTKGAAYVAPDVVLDFLRDFVGVSTDVRRHNAELCEACDKIQDFVFEMLFESYKTPEDGGLVFSPLHLPTFLKPKDFAKVYLPSMKRFVEEITVKRNYTLLFFMENDWMPYLDLLQELPEGGKVIGLFEFGDLKQYKERIGSKMTIAGGMPINLLGMGTKQQCIDKAKECLDNYAPGGNYIFSVDMVLMNLKDAMPENVIATMQYVHDNGKY